MEQWRINALFPDGQVVEGLRWEDNTFWDNEVDARAALNSLAVYTDATLSLQHRTVTPWQ